jgi:glycosyltransferase involved in cell wall biosynthesis
MQKTAIVCVTNDLCTDNRVHKVCLTLQKCGYFVILYGRYLPDSKPLHRPYFIERKKHWFNRGPLFYAEYNIRLFIYLILSESNLIIANDADTLPAAYYAARLKRKRLVFDAHELFSEVPELANRPFVKKIWQKIEDFFIPRVNESYTVCNSIASYFNKYLTDTKVIRNIPLLRTTHYSDKLSYPGKKIILYQGALNVGRGIEWVIDAMPLIDNAVFVIIGDGDIRAKLEKQVTQLNLSEKVIFKGKINAEDLHAYTVCANLGLCLLENLGLNYYYSLPNRIFDYMHAGVPVLATDFPEISTVVNEYESGYLINSYEPVYLAGVISDILNEPVDKQHFERISQDLCWENEEKKLMQIIQ